MVPAIRVRGLSKEYQLGRRESYVAIRDVVTNLFRRSAAREPADRFWALRDVSFDVMPGDVLGLIGRNGAGKSTLLKILSRITEPTAGYAEIQGRVGSLLEVGTGFHPELTGRENILLSGTILGMKRAEILAKFDEIVAFSEIPDFIDTQVKHYSSGMFTRLAFAVAAHLETEVLMVDEVLAVGDAAFQERCLRKMHDVSTSGRTVVFVSHNMDSIRKLCSTAIHLARGTVEASGRAADVIQEYLSQFHTDGGEGVLRYGAERRGFVIDRVEILDVDGAPMPVIHTWDAVRFRIYFQSPRAIKGGTGVVLSIQSLAGATLNFFANEPDQTTTLPFKVGENVVDLVVPQIMLSAGKYLVQVDLAITNAEWLVRSDGAVLEIQPRDVFDSGLAPRQPRSFIAQDYRFSLASTGVPSGPTE